MNKKQLKHIFLDEEKFRRKSSEKFNKNQCKLAQPYADVTTGGSPELIWFTRYRSC